MIELVFGGIVYYATLIRCYDGDTCTIRFMDSNPIVAQQNVRLDKFDTPEIRGKCPMERSKALQARDETINYLRLHNRGIVRDNSDKYGRIVVEFPGLAKHLVNQNLARYYDGGKRQGWCDG